MKPAPKPPVTPVCLDCRRAKREHCVYCAGWAVLP